jgi:hypothetical protein
MRNNAMHAEDGVRYRVAAAVGRQGGRTGLGWLPGGMQVEQAYSSWPASHNCFASPTGRDVFPGRWTRGGGV